jgi:hypothetical protein
MCKISRSDLNKLFFFFLFKQYVWFETAMSSDTTLQVTTHVQGLLVTSAAD